MKKMKLLAFGILFVVLLSCGLNIAQLGRLPRPKKDLISRIQFTSFEGLGEKEASNPTDNPALSLPNANPSIGAPNREDPVHPAVNDSHQANFSFVDRLGVWIEKKNGVQVTTMPNGERFILPDEI